ncbi:MAG TPA: ECF-type sigma factor [Thermoanaerobaculia bacterium]|nr:ECF-type sigma factor [Thermoanaerobaculia bacterium]
MDSSNGVSAATEGPERAEITRLLRASAAGDREAFDRLMPLLYGDLRRIAHRQLGRLRPGQTWNTTALVHEVYLKLADKDGDYQDRAHFFALSARAMRQILVDYSRRRNAAKRGGVQVAETLDENFHAAAAEAEQVLALEQALARLAELDPRLVQVVECRVFAGYTEEETAQALAISLRSVQRYWMRARAWLAEEMKP